MLSLFCIVVRTLVSRFFIPTMDDAWIESLLKKDQNENKIFKIINVQIENGVPKGVNYGSVINRVKFEVFLRSGRRLTKSLIAKEKHKGIVGEALKELDVFKTETNVYRDILFNMELLMEEFNDPKEKLWCQMYGFKPYNTIVFEDLLPLGYKLMERRDGLGIYEGKFVTKELGRFHAMSKILMERGILNENDLRPFYPTLDIEMVKKLYQGGIRQLSVAMKDKWPEKWKNVAEHIGKQEDIIIDRIRDLLIFEKNNDSIFKVMNHGDCWTCNMMFKHDDETKIPISLKLVDFQACHIGSYMWDVINFIYISIKPDIRRQHLNDFYKSYFNSLTSTLRFYGYGKTVPTFERLLKEADRLEYFTFICLGVYYPGTTSDLDQPLDMEKCMEANGEMINSKVFHSQKFIDSCGEDFERLVINGVI